LYAIKQISLTEIEDLPLSDVETIQEQYKIVGRETELECALAAIRARKHIFFEGIVGVGKTVIANALASY